MATARRSGARKPAEMHQARAALTRVLPAAPTHSEIAVRAYELWIAQGCPPDAADQNWLEAERQLRSKN